MDPDYENLYPSLDELPMPGAFPTTTGHRRSPRRLDRPATSRRESLESKSLTPSETKTSALRLKGTGTAQSPLEVEDLDDQLAGDAPRLLAGTSRAWNDVAVSPSTPRSSQKRASPSTVPKRRTRQRLEADPPIAGRSMSVSPAKARTGIKAKPRASLPGRQSPTSHFAPLEAFDSDTESEDTAPEDSPEEVHLEDTDQLSDVDIPEDQRDKVKELVDLLTQPQYPDEEISESHEVQGLNPEIQLRHYQVLGVHWLRKREEDGKGGILADEMGLGKTLQIFCRIIEDIEGKARHEVRMPTFLSETESPGLSALLLYFLSGSGKYSALGGFQRNYALLFTTINVGKNAAKMYELLNADVILTTFDTLKSEFHQFNTVNKKPKLSDYWKGGVPTPLGMREKPAGALYTLNLRFRRVILDEGHIVRNPQSKRAEAVYALKSEYRWVLTGTPIHNSLIDLHSLFRFLKSRPFSDLAWFKENIDGPVKKGREDDEYKNAMKKLHIILNRVMLRRMKDHVLNGQKVLDLGDVEMNQINCRLEGFEREIYDALQARIDNVVLRLLAQAAEKKGKRLNIGCIWVLILRLRQACLHPSLIIKDFSVNEQEVKQVTQEQGAQADDVVERNSNRDRCTLCGFRLEGPSADITAHKDECGKVMEIARQKLAEHSSGSDRMVRSSKIKQILRILDEIRRRPYNEKTIIYSQFKQMLEVIEEFLRGKYQYAFYHGKLTASERETALRKIKDNDNVTVILVSLMAGGVGLNLQECNNVILADLWWNPAVEEQAIGRAHRIGQQKKVHVYKLVTAWTIEERIVALQEKKRAIANAALDSDEISEVAKLTKDEIIQLVTTVRRSDVQNEIWTPSQPIFP
ncbi:hypothetical protein D9758_012087 [Tetrapyrgos nigripes]|uniref:Uncharacterized protein n=1 Tax=Tetrapyrgos nigripes TaxID=182062 RepID=A0A8H5CDH9_9AGAR|nr:hypothetical protein D9758_012087 [Tetrapyrgos nigripes]